MKKLVFVVMIVLGLVAMVGLTVQTPVPVRASAPAAPKANCQWVTVSEYTTQTLTLNPHWTNPTSPALCFGITFGKPGVFTVSSGWVFTSPLTLDGISVPTQMIAGELAPQITIPVIKRVAASQAVIFEPTWLETGSELGLRYNFDPPYRIFLPLVVR